MSIDCNTQSLLQYKESAVGRCLVLDDKVALSINVATIACQLLLPLTCIACLLLVSLLLDL